MELIRVMPWGKGQGDFVEINKEDFDPQKHTLYSEDAPQLNLTKIPKKQTEWK